MNFYDTVTEMGYHIKEKISTCILIEKNFDLCDSLILFDLEEKTIHGALKTTDLISTIGQTASWYSAFRQMKADTKKLSELAKYHII